MFHDPRPWIVVEFCGGFLLVLAFPRLAEGKPRPTELQLSTVACLTCQAGQALLADDGRPTIAPEAVEVHDLASLKPADAARLDGKQALYRVVIDGPRDRQGDGDVYKVLPRGDPQGILLLAAGR